jgi:hypothetical protein
MAPRKITRIKDLPGNVNLGSVRFRYPGDGQCYYWVGQWQKGIWGKKDLSSQQMYPLHVAALSETFEWEVVPA